LGLAIVLFGICLGASIEIIQPYVNRFGDLNDFKADVIGILLGYLLGRFTYKYNKYYFSITAPK
jgi:VanZ family protein